MSRNSSSDNSVGIVVVDNSAADVTMLRKSSFEPNVAGLLHALPRGERSVELFFNAIVSAPNFALQIALSSAFLAWVRGLIQQPKALDDSLGPATGAPRCTDFRILNS
jgi:hypothetical protein